MNIMTTLLVHMDNTILSPEFQMWQMNHKNFEHFELPEQSKGYIDQLNVMSNHFLPHLYYPSLHRMCNTFTTDAIYSRWISMSVY